MTTDHMPIVLLKGMSVYFHPIFQILLVYTLEKTIQSKNYVPTTHFLTPYSDFRAWKSQLWHSSKNDSKNDSKRAVPLDAMDYYHKKYVIQFLLDTWVIKYEFVKMFIDK